MFSPKLVILAILGPGPSQMGIVQYQILEIRTLSEAKMGMVIIDFAEPCELQVILGEGPRLALARPSRPI